MADILSFSQRFAHNPPPNRPSPPLPSSSSSPSPSLAASVDGQLRPSPRPAAKYFESDERSKLLSPGPINSASILRDMRVREVHTSIPVLPSSSCIDCRFVDCEDALCLADVEPSLKLCSDADHCPLSSRHLHDTYIDAVCEMDGCEGGDACDGNFEEFLQCCTDYHSYLGLPQMVPNSQINWDSSTWHDLLSSQPASYSNPSSPRVPVDPARSFAASPSSMNTINSSQQSSFPSFHHPLAPFASPGPVASPQPQRRTAPPPSSAPSAPQTRNGPLMCLWANCNASFNTMNELVGHVNLLHLRPASNMLRYANMNNQNALSCLWGDCQISSGMPNFAAGQFAGPSSMPGPGSNSQLDAAALNMLSSHLLHDHLGLQVQPNALQAQSLSSPSPTGFGTLPPVPAAFVAPRMHGQPTQNQSQMSSGIPSPKSSPSQTPEPAAGEESHHDCATSAHICHWESCALSFTTCDALTSHITTAHVGSGRSHYDCYWSNCNRHGEQGFASKQKILRHLQSHTGHRPFQCQICRQNFSEAATLQQHMRRHTQEKPFVCDFPGCGKAFAITGALTIHKRTHNGDRPFKCPHCEKAFAESSNLSKHVRTHTGLRPYSCIELGCDKSFARPDQLHRHMNVHTKKKIAQSAGVEKST